MIRELEGPLPGDVLLEIVYAPTFHAHLGVRITRAQQLEWWQHDFVTTASLVAPLELPELRASTRSDDRRDGMSILFRTPQLATERSTVDDDADEVLVEFARRFLEVLRDRFPNPAQQQVLSDLRRYLV
ncbi:MAG: hypothetical protein QM817_39865 [Archangium sp.]